MGEGQDEGGEGNDNDGGKGKGGESMEGGIKIWFKILLMNYKFVDVEGKIYLGLGSSTNLKFR